MRLPEADDAVFKAIADATRRQILSALAERPLAVHDLAAKFPVSRPAISKHLRILNEAGLVAASRAGKENRYALSADRLVEIETWLASVWRPRLQLLKRLAEGDS